MTRRKKLVVRYGDKWEAYPDHRCFATCDDIVNFFSRPETRSYIVNTSTENLLFAVRAYIATGKINADVTFFDDNNLDNGEPLSCTVNKEGRMSSAVPAQSHIDVCLEMLLGYTR